MPRELVLLAAKSGLIFLLIDSTAICEFQAPFLSKDCANFPDM